MVLEGDLGFFQSVLQVKHFHLLGLCVLLDSLGLNLSRLVVWGGNHAATCCVCVQVAGRVSRSVSFMGSSFLVFLIKLL